MDIELLKMLLKHASSQTTQIAIALGIITDELKRQPNFDVASFEAAMLSAANRFPEEEHEIVRLLLNLAGGKPPPESQPD
jgi:hypothetical protein